MVTVSSMHEEVDERTRGEEEVRQNPEHMRSMLFPEEKARNRQEDADPDSDRCRPK
jgi:hypothetical protein